MQRSNNLRALVDAFAKEAFGRKPNFDECVACGVEVTPESFRDELSWREYKISHLCQKCQDSVFGE